ncbi:cell division protein FtsK/SpoIIIE [Candidatus Protofrankia datiscae]|uniref:Cell division protein FtsK/SpoIIIE n=1 Tax=Candidatus Protofrankia datiscae TaxID=2716812 RepID=F8B1T5_9ACTN|nr:cell division protein FtsK/SpoIIIE [Candidatus Protofrankia datiscae]
MTAPVSLSKENPDVGDVVPLRPWTPVVPPSGGDDAVIEVTADDIEPPVTATGHVVPAADAESACEALALTAGRRLARGAFQVGRGHGVWAQRAIDATTHAAIREQIRRARMAGDGEALATWLDHLRQAKADRRQRLLNLPAALRSAVISVIALVAFLAGLLLLAGVVVAVTRPLGMTWDGYWSALAGIGDVVATLIAVAVRVVLWGAGPAWLVAAYRAGGGESMPGWLATSSDADIDLAIDESTIAQALAALRIPQIRDHLKTAPLQYLTTARKDGRGTHAVIRLPSGVTAERISTRRADLASGLHRLAKEVWPTTGSEAGVLDLWVADKGALAEGAGPYPLLTDGAVDVFKGVPFGRTLRGTPLTAPIMERNTITGGMPGQGKSSAARVIMAGVALDPTAELRIWVPDANYDFEAFRPRCSRYVMGAETDKIRSILSDLRELHAEVQARGQLLIKYEVPAVTRELASKGVGLHPLVCLLEEAHVAIQHKKHGEEIGELLVDIVRLGRKRGIHLIVSTQAPTKDSMPRDVTRNCSNGIAYAVGDHVANDALLGQGAYRAGHRATELIPGTDAGTAIVKGFTGERSEIAQTYFIHVAQVPGIIRRSLEAIARSGRAVPGTDAVRAIPEMEKARDHLLS